MKRFWLVRIWGCMLVQSGMLFCLAPQALTAPFNLGLPIRCTLGQDCFIQNYFDHGTGAHPQDYACGALTYASHHGTDFRLRDLAAMRKGVAVVAAAPGIVAGVRDGEPDINVKQRDKAGLKGKEAGNGVRIDHGDGWSTQYSHMLLGSVKVRVGQKVQTGDVLGMVGLSGNTEFPHVDLTIRKDGNPVDPFNPDSARCGTVTSTLWSPAVLPQLHYQPTGFLISGFAAKPPEREIAESGGYSLQSIAADADSLAYWVQIFGLHKDDRLTLELYDPDKQLFSRNTMQIPGDKAVWFTVSGRKRKKSAWAKGVYQAIVKLERAGKTVLEECKAIEVR